MTEKADQARAYQRAMRKLMRAHRNEGRSRANIRARHRDEFDLLLAEEYLAEGIEWMRPGGWRNGRAVKVADFLRSHRT